MEFDWVRATSDWLWIPIAACNESDHKGDADATIFAHAAKNRRLRRALIQNAAVSRSWNSCLIRRAFEGSLLWKKCEFSCAGLALAHAHLAGGGEGRLITPPARFVRGIWWGRAEHAK